MPSLGGTNNVGELSVILQLKIDDREWRADRESDQEAVTAFLQEAMTIGTLY